MAGFRTFLALPALLLLFPGGVKSQYDVPDVLVEALSPRGLRVSIPDEEGVLLFAFHGKINEEMVGREAGTFSVDITKAKNGRWTYLAPGARLKVGDIVYYWVNVDYDDGIHGRRGYIRDNQEFVVNELIIDESAPSTTSTTTTTRRTTTKTRPTPTRTTKTTTRTTVAPPTKPTTTDPDCQESPTIVKRRNRCQGDLVFEENFAALNEKKWAPEVKFAGDPDYEFVIYNNQRENLFVTKNQLHIRPTLVEDKYGQGYVTSPDGIDLGANCTGLPGSFDCVQKPKAWLILPPAISAQVSTKDHFTFTYGVVEVRAKLPKGDWIYPEIYLVPRSENYGDGLDSGLIRIAYSTGNEDQSKQLLGGCVLGQSIAARNYGLKDIRSERHWNRDFHVFKVEWKPDSIVVSVDDRVYGTVFPPDEGFSSKNRELGLSEAAVNRWKEGTLMAPFDKEMYIALGVGVGGQCFPNQENGKKPWDNNDPKAQLNFYRAQSTWSATWDADSELIVDYIKVYAL